MYTSEYVLLIPIHSTYSSSGREVEEKGPNTCQVAVVDNC